MPSCRRCGRDLVQAEIHVNNWAEIPKKKFYLCGKCGGHWLYSKSLNCPVLIDTRNIIKDDVGGRGARRGS